jgi:GDP-L-fucose synthase
MFKNKKVLVTGGSGMIGRQLVDLLLEREADVYVASLDESPNLPWQVKYSQTDLTVYSNCAYVCKDMDYVFNLVGIKASPKACLERPADIMVPMLLFNTHMMEAARKANVEWYLMVILVLLDQQMFMDLMTILI